MYKKMILSLVPDNLKRQLATEKGTLTDALTYVVLGDVLVTIGLLISVVISTLLSAALYGGKITGETSGIYASILGVGLVANLVFVVLLFLLPSCLIFFTTESCGSLQSFLGDRVVILPRSIILQYLVRGGGS